MVKIEFLGIDDIERFYERRARREFTKYFDETDYSDWKNSKPKYRRVDVSLENIRSAENTLLFHGYFDPVFPVLNYTTEDINNGSKIILQKGISSEERRELIEEEDEWANNIIKIALLEAQAGELSRAGDLALQHLAVIKGPDVLIENGEDIERRIDFVEVCEDLGHVLTERYAIFDDCKQNEDDWWTSKKPQPDVVYEWSRREEKVIPINKEIWDIAHAEVFRLLNRDFFRSNKKGITRNPLFRWDQYRGKKNTYRRYLTRAVYFGILDMLEREAYYKNPSQSLMKERTDRRKGISQADAHGLAMAINPLLEWNNLKSLQMLEDFSHYLLKEDIRKVNPYGIWRKNKFPIEKKLHEIKPNKAAQILNSSMPVRWIRRMIKDWSEWVYKRDAMFVDQVNIERPGRINKNDPRNIVNIETAWAR